MEGSNCPQCGSGRISVSETKTQVTHTCDKCGYSETQTKGNRLFAVLFLVMLAACAAATIWAGGAS